MIVRKKKTLHILYTIYKEGEREKYDTRLNRLCS